MCLEKQIKEIMQQINDLTVTDDNTLPQNTFYLNEKQILCCEREKGISRFPYDADGLVVWARSNGHIDAYESTFTIFKELVFSEDANISFIGGIDNKKDGFFPVSVLECGKQLFESSDIKRYVVYSFRCVYYIVDTTDITFAVRLHVDEKKHIHFAYTAINKTQYEQKIYMLSSIDAWLFYRNTGGVYDAMNRFAKILDNSNFMLRSYEDCMIVARDAFGKEPINEYITTSKFDVIDQGGSLITNAKCLKTGIFKEQHLATNTASTPICADCAHYILDAHESVRREYELVYKHSLKELEPFFNIKPEIEKIDTDLKNDDDQAHKKLDYMRVEFSDYSGIINATVLNKFIHNIQKQISFCALGKNYAGTFMGIRDVMQQLETSLIWQPIESRKQFINALNYILEDGRPPRQYSVPDSPEDIPPFDLRKFIDQGVWIISTLYTYLSYTDDWSILSEKCGYYVAASDNSCVLAKSRIEDTVLDHIIKIMDYLCSNIDSDTGCLHTLFGDWNDALDGLGSTKDASCEYGTGVSVMATLQLYQNCREICEILEHIGGDDTKINEYRLLSEKLKNGLLKNAIDTNDVGQRRIVHGWGDKLSYKIGSWNDPDGVARYSSTANSFWAISGMIKNDPTLKEAIMQAYKCLDSKHGIKTFDQPFYMNTLEYVGRIARMTPGTFENAATYVHATMFAAAALFLMGESREAWRQMECGCVLTHQDCTKTPFVMPNSYFENKEYYMDGQSFSDWYTGSGTVFIKNLIKYGFGVCPIIEGLIIQTAKHMPTTDAALDIFVKGKSIKFVYKNENNDKRRFLVGGQEVIGEFDNLMDTKKIFIPTEQITDGMVIEVID